LLVGSAQEGPGGSQRDGRIRKPSQHESKAGVDGQVENFVVGKWDDLVHRFHLGPWQKGNAENGYIIEGREQEVFPSQLGHREGILGVA
jgi:hypothetical protein